MQDVQDQKRKLISSAIVHQLNFVVLEMNMYGPKISAMGFFNIGYNLIPTVTCSQLRLANTGLNMIHSSICNLHAAVGNNNDLCLGFISTSNTMRVVK